MRLRKDENLDEVTDADRRHEEQYDGLDRPDPEPLQRQQQQHVGRGNDDGPEQAECERAG